MTYLEELHVELEELQRKNTEQYMRNSEQTEYLLERINEEEKLLQEEADERRLKNRIDNLISEMYKAEELKDILQYKDSIFAYVNRYVKSDYKYNDYSLRNIIQSYYSILKNKSSIYNYVSLDKVSIQNNPMEQKLLGQFNDAKTDLESYVRTLLLSKGKEYADEDMVNNAMDEIIDKYENTGDIDFEDPLVNSFFNKEDIIRAINTILYFETNTNLPFNRHLESPILTITKRF